MHHQKLIKAASEWSFCPTKPYQRLAADVQSWNSWFMFCGRRRAGIQSLRRAEIEQPLTLLLLLKVPTIASDSELETMEEELKKAPSTSASSSSALSNQRLKLDERKVRVARAMCT